MNNRNMEYQPCRLCTYIFPFVLVGGIVFFSIFCITLHEKDIQGAIYSGIFSGLCVFMAKWLYDSAKIIVFFEEDGIRVINDGRTKHFYNSWGNYLCAYYCRDHKGGLLLVLSPNHLDNNQLKHIVKQKEIALKIRTCFDEVIAIGLFGDKDIYRIKEIILQKIPIVKDE